MGAHSSRSCWFPLSKATVVVAEVLEVAALEVAWAAAVADLVVVDSVADLAAAADSAVVDSAADLVAVD